MPSIRLQNLDVAYADDGPPDGPAVLLLHGWPDDSSSWKQVTPYLNNAGFRTIVPTLRGFGQTRFRSPSARRTADPGILAMDAIELMDVIGVERFSAVGHDWGSSIAEAIAVGWPSRVARLGLLSWSPRLGGLQMPAFEQAPLDWYQWMMATPAGEQAISRDRHGFTHFLWKSWGPTGWFDEATFAQVARSWENGDWINVTLHSYRSRWGVAKPDPSSAWLTRRSRARQRFHCL